MMTSLHFWSLKSRRAGWEGKNAPKKKRPLFWSIILLKSSKVPVCGISATGCHERESMENSVKMKRPSILKFAIASSCFVGFVAIACAWVVELVPSAGPMFTNGFIVGFPFLLLYGTIFVFESQIAEDGLRKLVDGVASGDKGSIKRFALLTHRMSQESVSDKFQQLYIRTMRSRARVYFTGAIILIIVIGIWAGHETARQEGRMIWQWQGIHWQWP